ncbi:hypothetical protein [Pyxidicoccus xibeiensis]|uniref:hypothetical protein n=1 Tax=Pyxidicoccus xibeiensis TaxID=2906759 RepID=UPI0020A6E3D5|nr:hypothetical protein [Pyxidicoccus xibeiensis]MCP3138359.1 hypothetical protein [Pyxidicoccus xibeiensis]
MVKAVSRQSRKTLLFVFSASLLACGAPQLEEGSAPEYGATEQSLTSSLSLPIRDSITGDTSVTNTVSAGTPPFTYYWQSTEQRAWDGTTIVSGWYAGSSTEWFYCPRTGSRGQEYFWSLKMEAYAVDANGAVSAVTYRGLPCSLPME